MGGHYELTLVVLVFVLFVQCTDGQHGALVELQKSNYGLRQPSKSGIAIGEMRGSQCFDRSRLCTKHRKYCNFKRIQYYCQKTCGKCPTSKPPGGGCFDIHPQCTANAKKGFCRGRAHEVRFMKAYCKKSCTFCRTTTPKKNSRKCGIGTIRNNRNGLYAIVGGKISTKGYFPWQVAIYYEDEFLCGGSLIDEQHVLSAAHCFKGIADDVDKYLIVLGEYNRKSDEGTEQQVKVSKITIHEKYDPISNQEDVAIVKLTEHARISDHIETICLPGESEERTTGSKCIISGWGKKYVTGEAVTILQELQVPVVDQQVCNRRHLFGRRPVTTKMMCTGYDDGYTFSSGCHGDSGGPLSCETPGKIWKVFGIVSWGSPQCNGLDRYTVYTKVNAYLPWIRQHTSD